MSATTLVLGTAAGVAALAALVLWRRGARRPLLEKVAREHGWSCALEEVEGVATHRAEGKIPTGYRWSLVHEPAATPQRLTLRVADYKARGYDLFIERRCDAAASVEEEQRASQVAVRRLGANKAAERFAELHDLHVGMGPFQKVFRVRSQSEEAARQIVSREVETKLLGKCFALVRSSVHLDEEGLEVRVQCEQACAEQLVAMVELGEALTREKPGG
jgi:hypothetical protein